MKKRSHSLAVQGRGPGDLIPGRRYPDSPVFSLCLCLTFPTTQCLVLGLQGPSGEWVSRSALSALHGVIPFSPQLCDFQNCSAVVASPALTVFEGQTSLSFLYHNLCAVLGGSRYKCLCSFRLLTGASPLLLGWLHRQLVVTAVVLGLGCLAVNCAQGGGSGRNEMMFKNQP